MTKGELLDLLQDETIRLAIREIAQPITAVMCERCKSPNVAVVGTDPVGMYRCQVCSYRGWDHRAKELWTA